MAFNKKFDKNKRPRRPAQSALFKRKRVCRFTAEGVEQIDYKDIDTLRDFVTETGKILPRKLTGLTARQQRHIAKAVKRARNMITMK